MKPTWFDSVWAALTHAYAARKAVIHLLINEVIGAAVGQAYSEIATGPTAVLNWHAIWHAMLLAGIVWARSYFTTPAAANDPAPAQPSSIPWKP
jgi:hypothetical protein